MKMVLFENEHTKVIIEEGILIGSFKCAFVDLELANKITEYRLEVQKGKNYPILSNIKAVKSSTKSARDFLASEEGCKGVLAAAVLIDSPITSMIGNFFMRVSKPLRPTKLFTDEAEAKIWLAQFVTKD